jgi:hypothetical protein
MAGLARPPKQARQTHQTYHDLVREKRYTNLICFFHKKFIEN